MWDTAESTGELRFFISALITSYLQRQGYTYANLVKILGALEEVRVEHMRIISEFEQRTAHAGGG
jgi:hypothetical protein